MIYAVQYKGRFEFGCLSKTKEELEDKIVRAYHGWKSAQVRDKREELKSMTVFMERFTKVRVTIEEIK